MIKTVEAEIDRSGQVRLLEPIKIGGSCRALVTILETEAVASSSETALLSERALEDWNRPEEDAAWSHL